ncbi:hypothetical protein FKM82_004214 [Ascaphus truei]
MEITFKEGPKSYLRVPALLVCLWFAEEYIDILLQL